MVVENSGEKLFHKQCLKLETSLNVFGNVRLFMYQRKSKTYFKNHFRLSLITLASMENA